MALEKALRGIVLGGVFLLPFIVLYVSSSLFFPFITGKNFAFRIIVELIAGAWIALAIVNPMYRPKRIWLLYAFGAFIAIIGVADIAGVYPLKSFWSNFERMEGWVTLAHLFAYFVVTTSVLTKQLWQRWWQTSLGVSVIVGIYALFQLLGFITINQGGIRLDATFGNATYLGVYMLFHVAIAALFLMREWREGSPAARVKYAWLYGIIIALDSFILFFTSTRGAILGLVGGAMLAALLLIFQNPRSSAARASGALIGLFLVCAGGLFATRNTEFVHNVLPLFRLATLADGTVFSRFMNWNMALEGFKERPLLGWGQENYSAVFDKYYDPNMYAQEPWFDRVHNVVFDWLIAGGIFGLLAYLSLYIFALLAIWRSGGFAPYERAILTGLLAGYFFYLLFTFDNITSYIFFVSLLAYIAVRAYGEVAAQTKMVSEGAFVAVALCAVLITGGTVWYVNADALAQNRLIIKGLSAQPEGAMKNLEYFKQASSYRSAGTQEAREQLSQAAISVVGSQFPNDVKLAFVRTAVEEMGKQSQEAPLSARFPYFTGILLNHAGLYEDARMALERAHELSPRKQSITFELGLNALARGANDEAVRYFKEAYDLAPQYDEAEVQYIAALIRAGRDAEAEPLLKGRIEDDTATNPRIASAYAAVGRFNKIAEIWEAHIARKPDDIEARFVLASAYHQAKNTAQALRVLNEIRKIAPEAMNDVDTFMQQIQPSTSQSK